VGGALGTAALTAATIAVAQRLRPAWRRDWARTLRELPWRDRRAVRRAVARGTAVEDPRLAEYAAAHAGYVRRWHDGRTKNLLLFGLSLLTVFDVATAAFQVSHGRWTSALSPGLGAVGFVLFCGVAFWTFRPEAKRRAEAARLANEQLLARRPDRT
jgi:hypothetical protein